MKRYFSLISFVFAISAFADDYPVNAGKDAAHTHASRALNNIVLVSPNDGKQSLPVLQSTQKYLYHDLLTSSFMALPGETLTPSFDWSGTWMNGYVYVDFGNDGSFETDVLSDGRPADGSDIVAYSSCNGRNSAGEVVSNGNVLNPPAFTLPAELPVGVYRMRYKVDWDCLDAGGNTVSGNDIVRNGGAIVDTRLVVHKPNVTLALYVGESETPLETKSDVPFGKPYSLQILEGVPEGKLVRSVRVRHGYGLDGPSEVHGTPQYIDETLPFFAFTDGMLSLPAAFVDGDVRVYLDLADAYSPLDEALNTTPSAGERIEGFALNSIRVAGSRTRTFTGDTPDAAYADFRAGQSVPVVPGVAATLTCSGTKTVDGSASALSAADATLYVDLNRDGRYQSAIEALGSDGVFTLPAALPAGLYAARLHFAAQGAMADFVLHVHNPVVSLTVDSPHGRILGKTLYDGSGNRLSGKGVPEQISAYRQAIFTAQPLVEGYEASEVEVTVLRPDGTLSCFSPRLTTLSTFTLPADSLYGDVTVRVEYTLQEDAAMLPVLDEDFDAELLDSQLWGTSQRYGAAWNRFIVDDPRVAYLSDGHLVCRCLANPGDIVGYDGQMISGAKETRGKFAFNHGYVEARILTTPHTGNFPAFWLMPEDQKDGWPTCGEIDIWETINTEDRAYHTVHSHWTYDLGKGGNGGNEACVNDGQWHTFGLLKEADRLTWYFDGDKVFTYSKSTSASELNQGQWPFDKAFYLILNQSVGTGSWAAAPDPSFIYETRFDWVRVYQTPDDAAADHNVTLGIGQITLPDSDAPASSSSVCYDLAGRRIVSPKSGDIYICNGRLMMAR